MKNINTQKIELEPLNIELITLQKDFENSKKESFHFQNFSKKELKITKIFNPNELNINEWINLGFSEKQAQIILKFKKIKGGNFNSINDLAECFVISDKKLEELKPFIQLKNIPVNKQNFDNFNTSNKIKNYVLKKFDPNKYILNDWQKIGFSEKQAQTILKYKQIVGGNFISKEQLKKCFVISEEKYQELEPFILFSTSNKENESKVNTQKIKKDLNTAQFKDFENYQISDEIKAKILGFRKALGGFYKKEQIFDVYGIDKNIATKIIEDFNLDINKIQKININLASEETLKKHIYFRKYAIKILENRQNNKLNSENIKNIIQNLDDFSKINAYIEF